MVSSVIDIVIVDDSSVFRKFLCHILDSAPGIHVSGMASNGKEAIELIQKLKPRVVLMDINMPGMDGFETTSQIMSLVPTPVIIISGEYNSTEVAKTFRSLEVGAVDILPKPPGVYSTEYPREIQSLITRIRLMSEVKVVKRNPVHKKPENFISVATDIQPYVPGHFSFRNTIDVIGIGASAGGPIAIQKLLLGLAGDFSIPIVMVQHIEPVFAEGFAQWLEMTTSKKVVIAADGMELKPGMIVLPPGDTHLGFRSEGVLETGKGPPDSGLRPSVHHLFSSMATTYGRSSLGIILTGMGKDGAQGLKMMKEKGAVTIAQDAASSMIHGMPGEAIRAGAATHIFSIEQMISYLNESNRKDTKYE
ncbi:MAG: chemotaxis-specific protein-glutamate methyltransferase CheB [Bacteroidetes bacterium]|nr:chemotaxis-specific protein-glutamate methyltransferase CheB [Bacteroidota bacterium]